jgi:hypothetical protein
MSFPTTPLYRQAIAWAASLVEPSISDHTLLSEARDVLRARIDSVTLKLLREGISEERARLFDAVLSEIGGNAFDHNLGQWHDIPGVFFGTEKTEMGMLCAVADRGQGVFATLSRVRPGLKDDYEALHVAFTERLSGRAPEQRGNGLKFVRSVLMNDGINMWYASGKAAYVIEEGKESWLADPTDPPVRGCCAILLLKTR